MVLILKVFSLVLFLSTLTTTRSAANAPLYQLCSNHTSNNSFQTNLHLLLKSLPSQASLAGGFYNTSTNTNGDDSVYVLALCRGDITPDSCEDCLNKTSQEIVQQCSNGKEASIFQEVCQIRYSGKNFFSEMVYAGKFPNSRNTNSTTSWNGANQMIVDNEEYTFKLTYLMRKISKEAAFDSPKMFATEEASLTSTHKMYGLGQCSRDISRDDCSKCLTGEVGDIVGCCSNKEGGFVVDNSCNLRYELYQFYESSPRKGSKRRTMVIIISNVLVLVLVTLMGSWFFYQYHKKKSNRGGPSPIELPLRNTVMHDENQMDNQDLQFMDLSTIKAATDDFSDSNKLGQGGFGTVYEGRLMDGNYVAVKRLSRKSSQGLVEFRNEVVLIAKLQHRNLVKLLGYGIEGEEKLLIYEYMPNKSLDVFIFDETRRFELDWKTCFNIIVGIARGLLYLHEDSRLTIIHRDLKPNNVLLDNEMNAKISDFGMARIFDQNQSHANTVRVVGTHGYMAPEYAMEGIFSVKSDVYSFGVVLLEMLSGKRSTGFYLLSEHGQTFLSYVWCLWNEGRKMEFIHTFLIESATEEELLRCLRIGLLCVQEDADDRPTMSSVLVYLGSNESTNLPQPRRPAFLVRGFASVLGQSTSSARENLLTISNVSGR